MHYFHTSLNVIKFSTMILKGLSDSERSKLIKAARDAAKKAYTHYSNFKVGASVITGKGSLITGCNVENASYGLTICAERSAISSAVAREGESMKIRALAVISENGRECPPCGACRQVIFEFGQDAIVIFQGKKGLEEIHISKLLPKGFIGRKTGRRLKMF
jgi:cytidine deaminase